ncbi:MAG: hypothetical protein ABL888_04060 [Pirellulaceae bacterium]
MKRRFRVGLFVCLAVALVSSNAIKSFGQTPNAIAPPAIPGHVQKVLEIEKLLAQPIDPKMNFDGVPFSDLCASMEFNVILDQSAIDDSLQMDMQISSPAINKPMSLDEFLSIVLRAHNATFIVEEYGLRVISADSAMEPHFFTTRFINCRSLLEKMDKNPKAAWNFRFSDAEKMANKIAKDAPQKTNNPSLSTGESSTAKNDAKPISQTEQLARLVTANITPDYWSTQQGEAELQIFDGILVVSNTREATKQVEKFIRELEYAYFK